MKSEALTVGVARYVKGKVISLLLLGAALVGLVVTELATRAFTQSDSYYQTHIPPRIAGAMLAFVFSQGMLRGIVWVMRRSKERQHGPADGPPGIIKLTDADCVGGYRHMPMLVLVICLVVAFLPT